ncbi:sucrose-6-phosphate hydrolase [Bacillus sp. CECT 9360]|uniref:glycoside hydrolase family 32 protein n=1 Tax=Bacillus sp. CECT 9360 TaxID=2845821 RepID=UPI001E41D16D|nr:sucrose-6-phosphate hydrolase [Bacillus sp. CECT 9360]CAH0345371.1 Sucrose-6-phosphate hydrolase [Bacillus sp. CECT 9360]
MEWTRQQRYRRLEDESPAVIQQLTHQVEMCPWRQTFHIQPRTGLLNDPNGFSYFNGYYHLFYQWFPLGPVHGLKYWYHMKSKDLVNWEDAGIGIKPGERYDSHGAYSGSAIEHDKKLHLIYTGNTRDENWERHPYQLLAIMNEKEEITKWEQPVIAEVPNGYTAHFRDPKVWKHGDRFYAVIGAQREDETGCAVLYSSLNLTDWKFEGELETNLRGFGYMWECPDYFELDGQGIFVLSPQGLHAAGDEFQNIYQSGYIIGKTLNLPDRKFEHGTFRELDRGFDFYAPQTMMAPDGRRIMIGWMGLPEIDYPTDKNGWAHCLTVPRQLSVKDGNLIQKPVSEFKSLRKEEVAFEARLENEVKTFDGFSGSRFELMCEVSDLNVEEFGIEFRASESKRTVIEYNALEKKVILDRSESGEAFGLEYGTSRSCLLDAEKFVFHLFVDTSSVEIFINDGVEVFTSRIFPDADCQQIRFYAKKGSVAVSARKWEL